MTARFNAIETRLTSPLTPCFPDGGKCAICGKKVPPGTYLLCEGDPSPCWVKAHELGLPQIDQDRCPRCTVKLETRGTVTPPPLNVMMERYFPQIPPEAKKRLIAQRHRPVILDMKCPRCAWGCLLVTLAVGIEVAIDD